MTREASTNGMGIKEARLQEIEALIERLAAGKSEPFQRYCQARLARLPKARLLLPPEEQEAFQQVSELRGE